MMNTTRVSLIAVLVILGAGAPLSSQNAPTQATDPDHAKHGLAVNLLRAINTAEATYKFKRGGSYAGWDVLLASDEFHPSKVITMLAKIDPQLANAQFSNGSEILPGWSLRSNLTADGQAYDLVLEDLTDKACGYAAIADERGVIRQSKAIDCKI
jgi:hypothetical protein